jgi:hypothetical protein
VGIVAHTGRGIDTPEDYEEFVREYREHAVGQAA